MGKQDRTWRFGVQQGAVGRYAAASRGMSCQQVWCPERRLPAARACLVVGEGARPQADHLQLAQDEPDVAAVGRLRQAGGRRSGNAWAGSRALWLAVEI